MLLVPLVGDVVETAGEVRHTVVSYAPYKNLPAVYVESAVNGTQSVPFSDIQKINGTPVTLTTGKVFEASSLVKRKAQLPQQNDKITAQGLTIKVKALKLRERSKLTDGMLIAGENEADESQITVRLADVQNIKRADGGSESARRVLSTYAEYLGGH
jgi:hypothetical protein